MLEALSYGGIESVLFVRPPSDELLGRYGHVRALGIAGSSRMMSPEDMDVHLPPVFEFLRRHNPSFVHYKTCSTFDSSPTVGSIGRAIDIGLDVFGNRLCPLVVGAPKLQRFCVFGNLFARSGLDSAPYRLDRHPTMKCHPVTPMDEADLREHLARQTLQPIRLVDVLALDDSNFDWQQAIGDGPGIVLFDTLREDHLCRIGASIWHVQQREQKPLFVVGSSGVDYALVDHWKGSGVLNERFRWAKRGGYQDRVIVVSGSCSPVTERQIAWAVEHDFAEIAVDTPVLDRTTDRSAEISRLSSTARFELGNGRSIIVHTCRGPDDPRIRDTNTSPQQLGQTLAAVLQQVLIAHPLTRTVVTGGDISGYVARALQIDALELLGPLAPGSPLCVARSVDNSVVDGLEITFKGGQVGHGDFFQTVLDGGPRDATE